MRRVAALAGVAFATLAAAPPAHAQFVSVVITDGGARTVSMVESRVRLSGHVSLDFHGDEAAGCAAAGLCGVSGTATWDPSGPGSLVAYGYRLHGKRFEGSFLAFGDPATGSPRTTAHVRRTATDGSTGLCADVGSQEFESVASEARRGKSFELGLIGTPGADFPVVENFRTRCTGPVSADVSDLLPRLLVSERTLRKGHGELDFSADRQFSSAGLAGTLHSNVVVHLGRAKDIQEDQSPDPGHESVRRLRAIDVKYRVERVSGQIVTGVRGLADPDLCGPLDACGLMGSVTTAPNASSGTAHLNAYGPLGRSRAELRRAVGLEPGRVPGGLETSGYAFWDKDAGSVTSALTRGGASDCSDSVPIGDGGLLSLDLAGGKVHVSYGSAELSSFDLLRTRCPGPSLRDVSGSGSAALAHTTVPLSTFRSRRVTLHLTAGHSYAADGYRGSAQSDITVVLRRTKVRQFVQVYHVPTGFDEVFARRIP